MKIMEAEEERGKEGVLESSYRSNVDDTTNNYKPLVY